MLYPTIPDQAALLWLSCTVCESLEVHHHRDLFFPLRTIPSLLAAQQLFQPISTVFMLIILQASMEESMYATMYSRHSRIVIPITRMPPLFTWMDRTTVPCASTPIL